MSDAEFIFTLRKLILHTHRASSGARDIASSFFRNMVLCGRVPGLDSPAVAYPAALVSTEVVAMNAEVVALRAVSTVLHQCWIHRLWFLLPLHHIDCNCRWLKSIRLAEEGIVLFPYQRASPRPFLFRLVLPTLVKSDLRARP